MHQIAEIVSFDDARARLGLGTPQADEPTTTPTVEATQATDAPAAKPAKKSPKRDNKPRGKSKGGGKPKPKPKLGVTALPLVDEQLDTDHRNAIGRRVVEMMFQAKWDYPRHNGMVFEFVDDLCDGFPCLPPELPEGTRRQVAQAFAAYCRENKIEFKLVSVS